eukprot:5424416-Amphidinium_carterae.1
MPPVVSRPQSQRARVPCRYALAGDMQELRHSSVEKASVERCTSIPLLQEIIAELSNFQITNSWFILGALEPSSYIEMDSLRCQCNIDMN